MVRVTVRELSVTAFGLVATSVLVFFVLDATGHRDWFSTDSHAASVGLSPERLGARDLPLFWNPTVKDADDRTRDDLSDLGLVARRGRAMNRLAHRGTACLPVLLPALTRLPSRLSPSVERDLLSVLDALSRRNPGLTNTDQEPSTELSPVARWTTFYQVSALDFRPNFAVRQASRLSRAPSSNAHTQLTRLGTYALSALVAELGEAKTPEAHARISNTLADITAIPLRPAASATRVEVLRVSEAWKAWWFAEHLEYEQLSSWQRVLAHLHETRYGQWLGRAMRGRFGVSAVTHRPVSLELAERLPVSVITSGLGGLLALAFIVAFGGGRALRRRPLRTRLVDLFGALVPGLGAFLGVYSVLLRLCAQRAGPEILGRVLDGLPRLFLSTSMIALVGALWLRRAAFRVALHAVRVEAEGWVIEGRAPGFKAMLRHALRVGVASLLAPLGLAAPAVLLASLLLEPLLGTEGMGALTFRALARMDAPWLMVASLSSVPIFLGRRWARRAMVWALALDSSPDALVDRHATASIAPPAMVSSGADPSDASRTP